MSPSPTLENQQRGYVIPIGGGEQRAGDMDVLRKFVKICGGDKAIISIIPTASSLEDTGDKYETIFEGIGVAEAVSLPINDRSDAEREEYIEQLNRSHGVFITGGNQLRLSTILGGTLVAQTVRRLNAAGVHVAGTSAGAAIMPEHMIAGGAAGTTPYENSVTLSPGIGLLKAVIIDQHFSQRDRMGRLLSAISYNPFMIGFGIDEDTGMFINPDMVLEVVGSGTVFVVDPSDLSFSSMSRATGTESLSLLDLKLHVLSEGCKYDMTSRTAFPPE